MTCLLLGLFSSLDVGKEGGKGVIGMGELTCECVCHSAQGAKGLRGVREGELTLTYLFGNNEAVGC